MTRLLFYTNEPVLAHGVSEVISTAAGLEMRHVCTTINEVRECAADIDVLILDLTSEVTFALLSELKSAVPNCKVVLWANTISTELAYQAMGLGVRGILRRTLSPELVVKCIQRVHQGELWFEKALTDRLLSSTRIPLSKREGQLVVLLSRGLKNKEIATELMITEGTVKVYLSKLFQKVGVKDRFELALYGLKNLSSEQGQPADLPHLSGLRSLVIDRPRQVPPSIIA
jgi:DNA-binding NarL/FixJ family response regulator